MAVTNPTKNVSVRRLERFKQKLGNEFYTKDEVDEKLDGPLYDAEEKAIIFPDSYSVAFDPTTKSIILT